MAFEVQKRKGITKRNLWLQGEANFRQSSLGNHHWKDPSTSDVIPLKLATLLKGNLR